MTRKLTHQTILAVNIIVKDDTGALAFSIILATKLFFLVWRASWFVSLVSYELAMLVADARDAIDFALKVFAICLSSLAYGLGVRQ